VKVNAVIFDLDGTITVPCLDFDQIRAEIGGIQGPLLEAMELMSALQREKALAILHRHELAAAQNSQLNPGATELLTHLRRENRSIGLVTRNRHDSVERICRIHNIYFDSVLTRQDGPSKPDPFPVQQACRIMDVPPENSIVVGDYLFDLISAKRAGAKSVLLTTQKNYADFISQADYVIDALSELPDVITQIENGQNQM